MRSNISKSVLFSLILLLFSSFSWAQFFAEKEPELLPEEQAFTVDASITDGVLSVTWIAAPDYYIYRDKLSISSTTTDVVIGEVAFPIGEFEDDPLFGKVEVYFDALDLNAPISAPANTQQIALVLQSQGCNKPVGVCYAPQTRLLTVDYHGSDSASQQSADVSIADAKTTTTPGNAVQSQSGQPQSVQPNPAQTGPDQSSSFWAYVFAAFGAGILLSFTPCVLPMIPILAGVIAGQNQPSKARSGWLAICYVAGTILTYAVAGWLAGKSGTQLQAHFQNPWVIGFICALLITLAMSLFGAFKLQLPSSVQTKLSGAGVDSKSASISSFALGLISALVVGACVSPVLIVTLGAAIAQGDPVLGMAIMSSMALGMGLLLIAFGFGAGWLLPKTGAWMNEIQVVFGFMVIGVAIYIASGIAAVPNLYLWAALLLITGSYLWRIVDQGDSSASSITHAVIRGLALVSLIWGGMALVGGATQGNDILRPLSSLAVSGEAAQKTGLPFNRVTKLSDAKQLLAQAKTEKQKVLVDFYADWCLDCKRMHRSTYLETEVAAALDGWQLIEIDVTKTSDLSEEVKAYFGVFGPPATLFIDTDGSEQSDLRRYGYMNKNTFLSMIAQANDKAKK